MKWHPPDVFHAPVGTAIFLLSFTGTILCFHAQTVAAATPFGQKKPATLLTLEDTSSSWCRGWQETDNCVLEINKGFVRKVNQL
jgi:hypothetical protein